MLCICMDDLIIRKAKDEQIARNTKAITNALLYSVTGVLVGSGIIGMSVVGNCLIIIGINKITKIIIKKTRVVNKVREVIRKGRVENAI